MTQQIETDVAISTIMKSFIYVILCGIVPAMLTCCSGLFSQASHSVSVDSERQHDEVLQLHDTQMFQNLARAFNGQPILISRYSQINQKLMTKLTPSASYARNITDTKNVSKSTVTMVDPQTSSVPASVVTTVGSAGSAIQSVAKPLAYGFTGSRVHTVDFQQDPVYDAPEVYDAFRDFIKSRKKDRHGNLICKNDGSPLLPVESQATPPNKERVCFPLKGAQKWDDDGHYYWVPIEYQDDFFALTMALSSATAPSPPSK